MELAVLIHLGCLRGLEAGGWRLEAGGWDLGPRTYSLELGAWSLEPGVWGLEPGIKPGTWSGSHADGLSPLLILFFPHGAHSASRGARTL